MIPSISQNDPQYRLQNEPPYMPQGVSRTYGTRCLLHTYGTRYVHTSGALGFSHLCETKRKDTLFLPAGDRRFLGMGGPGCPGRPSNMKAYLSRVFCTVYYLNLLTSLHLKHEYDL